MSSDYSLRDRCLHQRISRIIKDWNILVVVETGLLEGLSTLEFTSMAPRVVGIDIDPFNVEMTRIRLLGAGRTNFVLYAGNSPDVLRGISSLLPDPTLYFLDAHKVDSWPILDEIKAIHKGTGVIVIHDMVVPNHPELKGLDYRGCFLDYAYLKPALEEWSPSHRVEYNEESEPGSVGCGFFFPR